MLAFIVSGQRQRFPRFWPLIRWLLVLSQTLLLIWQPLLWLGGESPSALTIGLLVADIYALWWLLSSRRLRACFPGRAGLTALFADLALQQASN
ncbi:Inner membrane protein yfeZ [Raoultella terrigena]|uniref:Inner membrane protein yfeZ n=1 Tax=Raoultella terrigena TaxID=577 RepID=A0A4U9D0U2_RAOTE|nr:Inner membrane protein yfeZ [Raoultella terrigena]